MYGLETIKQMNEEATKEAKEKEVKPFFISSKSQIKNFPPFPFPIIGNFQPKGFMKVRELFVDSSGFGTEGESALTVTQFKNEIKIFHAYAIIEVGQFQVRIAEYIKILR